MSNIPLPISSLLLQMSLVATASIISATLQVFTSIAAQPTPSSYYTIPSIPHTEYGLFPVHGAKDKDYRVYQFNLVDLS